MPALVLALALCAAPALQAQRVALTFDDGFDPRAQDSAVVWNAGILRAMTDARVRAMLFPSGKLVGSSEGMALVHTWGDAGHAIGNHTWSHANFGSKRVALEFFEADILRNDSLLRGLPGFIPMLRFPYLKEGDTASKRDGLRVWLSARGYGIAPVSIDASDWYYSARYLSWRAAHPGADPAPFRDAYLAHLRERALYYDSLSRVLLGRSADHVLVLHTNAINAAFLADVIAMFRGMGWPVIPATEAFRDPLFAMQPVTLPAGESILWALAHARGLSGLRFPGEDEIYEKPLLDALGL